MVVGIGFQFNGEHPAVQDLVERMEPVCSAKFGSDVAGTPMPVRLEVRDEPVGVVPMCSGGSTQGLAGEGCSRVTVVQQDCHGARPDASLNR